MQSTTRGFTMIELLLVIAIITLITSIAMTQFGIARAKTIDTAKKADLATMRTALRSFHLDKGRMPHNYTCTGACVVDDSRTTLAIEDTNNPDNPTTESGRAYRASMQELVAGGYLSKVPESPGGAGYTYYDYGPGTAAGAIVGTALDAETPSTTGTPGSCRPFEVPDSVDDHQGLNPVFGIDDRYDWQTCLYEQSGQIVEGPCPGDPGYEGDAPISPNICSTMESSDYCLCNRY